MKTNKTNMKTIMKTIINFFGAMMRLLSNYYEILTYYEIFTCHSITQVSVFGALFSGTFLL